LRFLKEVACPCAAAFVHHSLAFVVSQIHVQQTPHFLINFPQQKQQTMTSKSKKNRKKIKSHPTHNGCKTKAQQNKETE
tara:strand:+ start:172 stop:408 length:237 start_codon:yes stop_codon:yes gene_type:complete